MDYLLTVRFFPSLEDANKSIAALNEGVIADTGNSPRLRAWFAICPHHGTNHIAAEPKTLMAQLRVYGTIAEVSQELPKGLETILHRSLEGMQIFAAGT